MKSLEIVNDKIAELKDTYQHYTAVEKDKVKSSFAKFDIEQFEQIKQDLEVLEILRKHLYIHTSYGDSDYGEYEDKSICINEIHECFCKEDFNKIKQWLEENENE